MSSAIVLRPYQVEAIAAVRQDWESGIRRVAVALATGLGKGFRPYDHVLTPSGWTTFGTIQVGDEVIGANGQRTTVTGVYPQGILPTYKVTFTDGASVFCNAEHLWAVGSRYTRYRVKNGVTRQNPFKIKTLSQIMEEGLIDNGGGYRHYIPMVSSSIDFEPVKLPIEPYLLGVLLGDGHLGEKSIKITAEHELIASLSLPEGTHTHFIEDAGLAGTYSLSGVQGRSVNSVMQELRSLGLAGTYSYSKFIPPVYLRGSVQQRLALLQGLMDTDGSVHTKSRSSSEFCTVSESLAQGVRALVRSLGGTCTYKKSTAGYAKNGIYTQCRDRYRLNVRLPQHLCPFRWKANRWSKFTKYSPVRAIKSVEQVENSEIICIAVDAPDHLYVTDDYVVTHNTEVFLEIAKDAMLEDKKVLILAHRDELLREPYTRFMRMVGAGCANKVGIIKALENQFDRQITIASVQSLCRERRLALMPKYDFIVVDECHHTAADSYVRILERAGVFNSDGPLLLGVSATIRREDSKQLGDIYQKVSYEMGILDGIKQGYLADLRGVEEIIQDLDLDKVAIRNGEYAADQLEVQMEKAHAPERIVEAYLKHLKGKKVIVFNSSVAAAHKTAAIFNAANVPAFAVDGTTDDDIRRQMNKDFLAGKFLVACNKAIYTEGTNFPDVEGIIEGCPHASLTAYIQEIGRGTRPFPGKKYCLIVDMTGNTSKHNLVTFAELFGINKKDAADGLVKAVQKKKQLLEEIEAERRNGVLVSKPVNLFRTEDGTPGFHWLSSRTNNSYLLSIQGGCIEIAPFASMDEDSDDILYDVILRKGNERRILSSGENIGFAQGIAEDYVRKTNQTHLTTSDAAWRLKPVSDAQKSFIRELGYTDTFPKSFNAGEASDLIAVLKADMLRSKPVVSREEGATQKQISYLRALGLWSFPPDFTKRQAAAEIDKRVRNRQAF